MRSAFIVLIAASLTACGIVYKLPTRQGNVIEQEELDALQLGMSREQVQFLLGTPIAATPFRKDRWDYFGYYKNPRGKVFTRTVSLYFENDSLARMEGQQASPQEGVDTPDLDAIAKEEKKAKTEEERAQEPTDSGIIIKPKD